MSEEPLNDGEGGSASEAAATPTESPADAPANDDSGWNHGSLETTSIKGGERRGLIYAEDEPPRRQ